MDKWFGKVAIVTGASAGIGAAICKQLLESGVIVVGFARRKERIEKIGNKINGYNENLHALKVDMTKEEDILDGFKWVESNVGPVHILINNAGVIKNTSLMDGDATLWKEVLDTNVLGLCIATREAVRSMRANNVDGHIVHINSVAGHWVVNYPNFNIYSASKFAVTALAQQLRYEFNEANCKIKITSISPGPVDTDILQANNMKFQKLNPILSSDDVSEAIMFVLSTKPNVLIQELIIQPVLRK